MAGDTLYIVALSSCKDLVGITGAPLFNIENMENAEDFWELVFFNTEFTEKTENTEDLRGRTF